MKYFLLGGVRIAAKDGGRRRSLVEVPNKIATLLATLLIRANVVVSVEQLVTELWADRPPSRATAALYVHVSQLRKMLSDRQDTNPIITRSPGYLMQVGENELDLHVFSRLIRQGRAYLHADQPGRASAILRSALALWHGPALNSLHDGPIANEFVAWLEELRLECVELSIKAELLNGRHRELLGNLRALVSQYPLNENYYGLLMLALYRCGRRADALRVYQCAQHTVHTELGVDPCPTLQELHAAILSKQVIAAPSGRHPRSGSG